MADFGGFNTTSVAAGVQGPTPISIKDMIGTARGLQQYGKEAATLESDIAQAKAESQQQQYAAEKAGVDLNQHYANLTRGLMGGLLSDPDVINGTPKMIEAIQDAADYAKKRGVKDTEGFADQLIATAKVDPAKAYQMIRNGVNQAGGVANQYQSIQATQNAPIYAGQEAPQPAPAAVSQGAQQGVTPQQMARPYGSKDFGGEALPYPVRQPGIQFNPGPSEAADATAGFNYRTDLRTRADAVPLNQRNIAEVQDVVKRIQASGVPTAGKPGEFQRWINQSLGTPLGIEYQRLNKDLAQVQISQMSENQLKTDAGRDLQAAASGTYTLTPDVLQGIARRQAANFTALDLQSRGAEKFANTYQDRNLKTFQKQWQANSDSKVFELISLKNSGLSKEELLQETKKLLGTNPEAIKKYALKAENIERLSNGLPPLKELK